MKNIIVDDVYDHMVVNVSYPVVNIVESLFLRLLRLCNDYMKTRLNETLSYEIF